MTVKRKSRKSRDEVLQVAEQSFLRFDKIRLVAFDLYVQSGYQDGLELEHWVMAEEIVSKAALEESKTLV